MTRPHHHTKLDDACERIVRPVTHDFLTGFRDGLRGVSAKNKATRWYISAYWNGRRSRENQWLATFGEGAAD